MRININHRSFETKSAGDNGTNFLFGNVHDFITETCLMSVDRNTYSSLTNAMTILAVDRLQWLGKEWAKEGFIAGDSLTITFTISGSETVINNAEILTINDDVITFSSNIFSSSLINSLFPMAENGEMKIFNNSFGVAWFEITHNLIENGEEFTEDSIVDGSSNVFKYDTSYSTNMFQVGNKSGGYYKSFKFMLTTSEVVPGYDPPIEDPEIDMGFEAVYTLPWEDGVVSKPDWFISENCLKSVFKARAYREQKNPNHYIEQIFDEDLGNTGWFDETQNTDIKYAPEIRINDDFKFDHTINNQFSLLGYSYTPVFNMNSTLVVTTLPPSSERNENNFTALQNCHYSSKGFFTEKFQNNNGGINVVFSQITGIGSFEFDNDLKAYFDSLPESERRIVISLVYKRGPTNQPTNLPLIQVTRLLFTGISEKKKDEPIETEFKLKNILDGYFADTFHEPTEMPMYLKYKKLNEITSDVKKINVKFYIQETAEQRGFILQENVIDLSNYPVNSQGFYVIDNVQPSGYYCDNDRIKNIIIKSIGNDFEFSFPFVLNYKYWEKQQNAPADYIDFNLPQNGQSKEWVSYSRYPRFTDPYVNGVSLEFLDKDNDVLFYAKKDDNHILDYEGLRESKYRDTTFRVLKDGVDVGTTLDENEIYEIEVTHSLFPSFVSDGCYVAIRPKEKDFTKIIDSKNIWTNSNLPLKPIAGENKLKSDLLTEGDRKTYNLLDTTGLKGKYILIGCITDSYQGLSANDFSNVNTIELTINPKIPKPQEPDVNNPDVFMLKTCQEPIKVLANTKNMDNANQNDVTSFWFKNYGRPMTAVIYYGGSKRKLNPSRQPLSKVNLPNDDDTTAWKIDWKNVVFGLGVNAPLITGCYDVFVFFDDNPDVEYKIGSYHLMNFNDYSAMGDVRLTTYIDDYSVKNDVNFKGSGFYTTLRFQGFFGKMQPNIETTQIEKVTTEVKEIVRNRAIRNYELKTAPLNSCMTKLIDETMLLMASSIKVSDYNPNNHRCYENKEVMLSRDADSVVFNEEAGSLYASMTIKLEDKANLDEYKYPNNP